MVTEGSIYKSQQTSKGESGVVGGAAGARGREVPIEWNGAPARAWVPTKLAEQEFELGPRAARLSERAVAAVVAAGSRSAHFGPVATLLLRSEGVASSYIEALRTPLADLAAAEAGGALGDVASYVADNLGTVVGALASPRRPLTPDNLHTWHRRLTEARGGLPDRMVGAYRSEQSYIGGTSPRDAAYVPPPPELVAELMEDLVSFANDDELDPVTQAAVVHAQFESIHPYGNDNGRIGRVLIGWVLTHRLDLTVPPPVSVLIARDPGGYLAGITLFRMGQLDTWVVWMATALERSSLAAGELMTRSEALVAKWRIRLASVREDAAVHRVLDLLVEQPVLSAAVVAERLGVSARAGQHALATLAERGIVERYRPELMSPGRPTQYWAAQELISVVAGWPGVS
jgi:Fic family protein